MFENKQNTQSSKSWWCCKPFFFGWADYSEM